MSGRTRDGGSLRILNIVNEYTRVALGSRVDRSIGASDVVSELARLFGRHGKPQVLRSDNGANSSQRAFSTGSPSTGRQAFYEKGSSQQQNPFAECFMDQTQGPVTGFHAVVDARDPGALTCGRAYY
jgi:putative transposase